ncbi:TetR/AcrR family transcriptional regulator [Frankia sp. CN6]|uniref:TetR/AcrR family transcriptional regulator n=1 Tax=Frankia nepalensis TaxID=1836974 RepID=A0A937UVN9_9ACTN|nr:TetR/AcrR family transcriptional regulator [Frankia nepalensis]MBL7633420.1 TetR/AcrR family transcriptional regulator [Frankia nepalensis]
MADSPNRLELRKARTRAALIQAAQQLIAEGQAHAPIAAITEAADVGLGTFYNHFESREQLVEVAVLDALDVQGAFLDDVTSDLEDPAARFAQAFRLTGRFHRLNPQLSRVLLNTGIKLMSAPTGLAHRARRDLQGAADAGRFTIPDLDVALALTAGAALALGQLLHDQPDRDAAVTTDAVTTDLLRAFGLPDSEARHLTSLPLPALPTK